MKNRTVKCYRVEMTFGELEIKTVIRATHYTDKVGENIGRTPGHLRGQRVFYSHDKIVAYYPLDQLTSTQVIPDPALESKPEEVPV